MDYLVILDKAYEFFRVIFFAIDRHRWTKSLVERDVKLFWKEACILPVDDSSDLERFWVDNNVLLRKVVMAEDIFSS